ncbi:DUF2085 domain-containing protein [Candidatus Fermentibacteria bacterium]|nr:DUF2085 domain-containing protein [Candidatus Fermentibacteria bacterium]
MGRRLTPFTSPSARAAVFVVASLPALAMLAASLVQPVVGGDFGAALGRFLGYTCHRLPRRCLTLPWGLSGLCARCTAFWAGLGTGTAVTGITGMGVRRPLDGLAMTAPMALDGLLQAVGLYESLNAVRVATGLAGGWGTGIMFVWLFCLLLERRFPARDRIRQTGRRARNRRA